MCHVSSLAMTHDTSWEVENCRSGGYESTGYVGLFVRPPELAVNDN
jgi:hypothetical protein